MLAKIALSLLFASVAIGDPHGHPWQHPLPTDRKPLITDGDCNARQLSVWLGRSPCPAVNALANHGYLPRNGLNVSLEQFTTGFNESLNFDAEFVAFAVAVYQNFTTTGYNNTLNLNDLDHHASKMLLIYFDPRLRYYSRVVYLTYCLSLSPRRTRWQPQPQ